MTAGLRMQTFGAAPVLQVKGLRLTLAERFFKRIVDISISLFFLFLLSPLFIILAFAIKHESKGPVFYKRKVLGLRGHEFNAFKFRTMVTDGDRFLDENPELREELRVNHKLKSDPRITSLGASLRNYSIDELPQLFNVLWGQMSLVGPRMITREELRKYGILCQNLLSVKPGMTGVWQVSGRSELSYEERVNLDMHYIRNYSIWRDLQILFIQTLPAVIRGRGAC
jgi:lipopolysaccharide/colanic/teichoic acid biosynthesis glycosyltransferase